MRPLTTQELQEAVRDGAPVRFNLPVVVRREDQGETWTLNLAGAWRGEADPWHCTRIAGPVVYLETAGDVGMAVGGLTVQAADLPHVRRALAFAPKVGSRHDPESNARRLEAGRAALQVSDAMVRARLLDAVDGWSALEESGKVIDRDPVHGILVEPPETLGLTVRVLVVRCPSTARVYAIRVPRTMTSAKKARLWSLHGVEPEVEA